MKPVGVINSPSSNDPEDRPAPEPRRSGRGMHPHTGKLVGVGHPGPKLNPTQGPVPKPRTVFDVFGCEQRQRPTPAPRPDADPEEGEALPPKAALRHQQRRQAQKEKRKEELMRKKHKEEMEVMRKKHEEEQEVMRKKHEEEKEVMRKDEEKLLEESVSDSDSWTGRVQGRQGGSRDRQDGDLWPASYVPLLPRCSRG